MKNKAVLRVASLILALGMIFMLGACGNSANEPGATGGTTAKDASAADSAAKPADDANSPVTFTIFMNHPWYPIDKFEGIIPQEITKKTGVTLKPTIAVDDKQLGLMIASGNLPDLVYTSLLLDRLSSPNLCYSYNELIQKYTPDWAPNPMQIGNAKTFSPDDNYYTLLNHFSVDSDWDNSNAVQMAPSLAYRQDILEALGNPAMDTLDDYVKVLGMVKEKYPNMVPLTFDVNWTFQCFKIWVGAYDQDFIEQDGKVVYTIHDKKYLDYLKFINSLYRKGYMIADNFAWKSADAGNYINSDKSFSHTMCTQNGCYPTNLTLQKVNPKGHLVESKPLGEKVYTASDIGWSGTFITKSNKNPDRAMKLVQWMYSEEAQRLTQWGREGTDYTLNEKGMPEFSQEWMDAAKDADTQNAKYNTWFYLGGSEIVEAAGRCASIPADEYLKYYEGPYKEIRTNFHNLPWFSAALPKEGMDEKVVYDKLKDLVKNDEVKIFLSSSDDEFNQNYQNMMKKADQLGVQKLEDYMSQKVPEVKKMYQ